MTTAQQVDKPPYRIPSMAEIAQVRGTNGLKVMSTFSGCGGSCLGFEMAGFEILSASEFVAEARETYMANHPGVRIDGRDIRDVTAQELLDAAGLQAGELDVFEGSPPCSAFSTAGKRSAGWGSSSKYSDTEQRVDDLFFEFARLVKGVAPKVFVAENVAGLVKGVAKGYFQEIIAALRDGGAYRVKAQVLDAKWLGVPQSRSRVIFVGVREDLGKDPAFPKPLPYQYTLREAILLDGRLMAQGLGSYEDRGKGPVPTRDFADGPSPTIATQGPAGTADYGIEVEARAITRAGGWKDGEPVPIIPVDLDAPAPVITANGVGIGSQTQTAISGPVAEGEEVIEVEARVTHDPGGHPNYARGDITDKPCAPITVGVNGIDSAHYQVEETRVVHDRAAFWSHGDITDRPAPTIGVSTGSDGEQSLASQHFRVLTRSRNEGHPEGRFIEVDPDEPAPVVTAHGIGVGGQAQTALAAPLIDGEGHIFDPETRERIDLKGTAIEAEWERTRPGESSDRYFNLARSDDEEPSPTVTMKAGSNRGTAGVTHSTQARKFTLGELRRLCGFPDDFVLTGKYAQRWERLGRAVPPPMMAAVAATIRDEILS